jgi:hypothetical protein
VETEEYDPFEKQPPHVQALTISNPSKIPVLDPESAKLG